MFGATGEMGKSRAETVIAERLPDLGAWELYVLTLEESVKTVCKVALRSGTPEGIAYGFFRGDEGEPSATGVLALPGGWSDEAREETLKEILTIYAARLPELRGGVVFDFYGEREDDEDDDEDDHDDEDDEESDPDDEDDDDDEGHG